MVNIEQTSKSDDLFNFLKQTIRDAEASINHQY
jgi:hypothetical protein